MTTVIRPSWVVVPSPAGPVAREGLSVAIDDGWIVEVDADLAAGDHTVDAPGRLLIPGFINAHTHLGASPLGRGFVDDLDLRGAPFYMVAASVTSLPYLPDYREELDALMEADLVGLLRSGVTTVVNQHAAEPAWLLERLDRSGVRAYSGPILPASAQARGTLGPDGRIVRVPVSPDVLEAELAAGIALHDRYDQGPDGRVRVIVGPASAETCPDEFLVAMARLNAEWGAPLTLHLAQSEHDLAQAQAMFGMTSAAHLGQLGLLGPNLIAAHGSLLSDDDVALLAAAGATVAHCATRKAREAVFSPFLRFVEAGLRVAIANDAFTVDFVEEIRAAALLGKLLLHDTARPTAADALAAATEAGADALGRPDLGRITAGARADLVLVDLRSPFIGGVLDPIRSLVYYATGREVETVWIDGQAVVEGRCLTTLDEAAAERNLAAATDRLWGVARERGALR
ncbi:MAG: amidohydrolase family protein [Dehalococcoidia bacterium]